MHYRLMEVNKSPPISTNVTEKVVTNDFSNLQQVAACIQINIKQQIIVLFFRIECSIVSSCKKSVGSLKQ